MKGFFWPRHAPPLIFIHPVTGHPWRLRDEGEGVRASPHGEARFLTCARESRRDAPANLVALLRDDDDHIFFEIQEPDTSKPLARFPHLSHSLAAMPGFVWRHHERIHHVVDATLFCFDMSTRRRSHTSPGELPRHMLDVLLSPCGRWLVCAGSGPGARARVVSFDLHDPHRPALHLADLDTRGMDSPLATSRHRGGAIKLVADATGERFIVHYSCRGAQVERWPGWRGSVACFEYATGRRVWHAEVDAELTGDWRGVHDLALEEDFVPGLCCHEERLFLGGWGGSAIELDARDGALRRAHHHAGIHGVEALTYLAQQEALLLLDGRGMLSTLELG